MPDTKIKPHHHPAKSSFRFPLSVCLFVPLCLSGQDPRSTLVETPLQIALFFAKQTQFQNGQYKHNYSKHKGLCQSTTNNEQRTLSKNKPKQTQSPPPGRNTQYDTRHTLHEIRHTLHKIRHTLHKIRHPTSDIRNKHLPNAGFQIEWTLDEYYVHRSS